MMLNPCRPCCSPGCPITPALIDSMPAMVTGQSTADGAFNGVLLKNVVVLPTGELQLYTGDLPFTPTPVYCGPDPRVGPVTYQIVLVNPNSQDCSLQGWITVRDPNYTGGKPLKTSICYYTDGSTWAFQFQIATVAAYWQYTYFANPIPDTSAALNFGVGTGPQRLSVDVTISAAKINSRTGVVTDGDVLGTAAGIPLQYLYFTDCTKPFVPTGWSALNGGLAHQFPVGGFPTPPEPWYPGRPVSSNSLAQPSSPNGFVYLCQVLAGQTGPTEPVWPTTISGTVVEITGVLWQCIARTGQPVAQVTTFQDGRAVAAGGTGLNLAPLAYVCCPDLFPLADLASFNIFGIGIANQLSTTNVPSLINFEASPIGVENTMSGYFGADNAIWFGQPSGYDFSIFKFDVSSHA